MATSPVRKLSAAERTVIVESLELKQKSHERAARASVGAISAAHSEAAASVSNLILVVKNLELEI